MSERGRMRDIMSFVLGPLLPIFLFFLVSESLRVAFHIDGIELC